jgi:hypothetical protein
VRRELSLNALQKRLGAFEPALALQASDRGATQAQAPRVGDAPPSHLRGKHASLAAVVDQRAVTAPERAVARPSLEELQQRSEDWSRLIAQLAREERHAHLESNSSTAAPDAIDAGRQRYTKRPVRENAETSKLYELYLRERVQLDLRPTKSTRKTPRTRAIATDPF